MIRALLCEPARGTKKRAWLERKMLAWFPFPFQLMNKLNLRLPQIAVKDEKQKTLPFHSCWRHLHPRCESHEMQKQTQRLRPLCPKHRHRRSSQTAWREDRRSASVFFTENQPLFWICFDEEYDKISGRSHLYQTNLTYRRRHRKRDWNSPRKVILQFCGLREPA